MTTDLSSAGIQRLLEIWSNAGRNPHAFHGTAAAVFPDLLRRIEALEEALSAIIDRSNNREMGTSKVADMRDIALKALEAP